MSLFSTKILVPLDATKKMLPKKSFVERVLWNEKESCVEIIWSNHLFKTPWSRPVECPIQVLKNKSCPPESEYVPEVKLPAELVP